MQLAWLAGLLEGEGTFYAYHNGKGYTYPHVVLQMTDEDVVVRAAEVAGLGRVYGPYSFNRAHGIGSKQMWAWRVQRQNDAADLMRELKPLLGSRRQRQIEEALAEWQSADVSRTQR